MGIATNYSIIKDLLDADVPLLVKEYLENPRIVCNQEVIDFTASILVFTTMTQEISVSSGVSTVSWPSSQSATPLAGSSASSLSYDLLCLQHKLVKDKHNRGKEQKRQGALSTKSNAKQNRQGNHREFRRHRVIDQPAHWSLATGTPAALLVQGTPRPAAARAAIDLQTIRVEASMVEAKRKKVEKEQQREARRLKKEKELAKKPSPRIEDMSKLQLVKGMEWEHPLISLPIGTVKANIKWAAAASTTTNANQVPSSEQQQQQQQQEVYACNQEGVGQVRVTKKHAQESLGMSTETVFERSLTKDDRTILSFLSPAVESKIPVGLQPNQDSQTTSSSFAGDSIEDEGEEDEDEVENGGDEDAEPSAMDKLFIACYQILLAHIYSRKSKTKSKTVAERQVDQLIARAAALGTTLPPVPPRTISYSTNELPESPTKQLYRSIKTMYRTGSINSQADGQPAAVLLKIDPTLPAIENFMILNKASGGSKHIAPLSPLSARYVGFTERQLLPMFWQWSTLKGKIRRMMVDDRYFQDPTIVPALADAQNWLSTIAPGLLVTTFLTDVGLSTDSIWKGKGYVLRGSIRTNGRLLQLLAFKVKELQSVRYHRIPEVKLPNPHVTTIGGTNGYLTEVRNVFRTAADMASLLAIDPSLVAALSIDLGTSCLAGASVSLPPGQTPTTLKRPSSERDQRKKKKPRRAKRKPGDWNRRSKRQKARKLAKQSQTTRHFDLVVKRKAVSQPTDSFANWFEGQKDNSTGASTGRTIQDLEPTLPPLKGEGASFREHVAARRVCEGDLDDFYNSTNFWKHAWDAEARSLGYLVIGINEHFTSKKCPVCNCFVRATTDWRTLYCMSCRRFRQRDAMASDNMNNAIQDHLIHQQRPLYLQPRRQDGSYPWMSVAGGGGGGGRGEAGGSAAEAMESEDGAGGGSGGGGGGGAASRRKRRAPSIVSLEVLNIDVDPTVDARGSSSIHTTKKAHK
ncbi:hypothetical protein BGW39_006691 [Mortierella sp. 14UC]|nr:hypothetical protein BGW39_006691 [Mortierella sp. 14UC]